MTLKDYREGQHIDVLSGRSHALLDAALRRAGVARSVMLELPGFLGLATVVATTDLIATVPRQIGETLARAGRLQVLRCPVDVPTFKVKQYWHARNHHDPGHRWLRGICAGLFRDGGPGMLE